MFKRNGGHHRRFGGGDHAGHGRHPGGGGRGLRGGRMASAADLQLIIAAFLAEKPRHGYEIIKAVQERSNGYYTPSAGMVYPSLTYLEEIGYASVAADGARKLYSLTDAGKSHVEQNRERVTALFSELTRVGQKMQRAQRAYEGESSVPAGSLDEVRRDLKAALFDAFDAPAAEQSRVVEILSRALAEINKR
jgi:DNA-binding PadR family transcriptional regulator